MFVMLALQLSSSVGEKTQFQEVKTKALHANPRHFSVPFAVLGVSASPSLLLRLCPAETTVDVAQNAKKV